MTERVLAGESSAVARMISRAERGEPDAYEDLAELYRFGGRARVVGITGPAGAGKSTLVAAIASELRRRGSRIGIVAIDPTSPYSGGSVLGDRIRMQALWGDPDVFIRSMATRGALGGIAQATSDAVTILDAAGNDVVLVETVGVGQDEVEIAQAAHTVVVVSAPGLGDDIQALKAGLLETADVHVVNKADRDGADRTVAELKTMQALSEARGWVAPVVATSADSGVGVDTVVSAIEDHYRWLVESGELELRLRAIARNRLKSLLTAMVHERIDGPARGSAMESALDALCRRAIDPWSAARAILEEQLNGGGKGIYERH